MTQDKTPVRALQYSVSGEFSHIQDALEDACGNYCAGIDNHPEAPIAILGVYECDADGFVDTMAPGDWLIIDACGCFVISDERFKLYFTAQ